MGRGVVKKCAALLMLAGAPTAFAMVKLQRAFTAIVPAKFQTDEQRAADAGTPGTFFQNVAGTPWETDFAATPNAKYEMFAGAAEQSAFDPTTKLVFAAGEQGYLHVFELTATGFEPRQAFNVADGHGLTDVEVCGDHVFVASEGPAGKRGRGQVHVLSINTDKTLTPRSVTTVGYLPDMVKPKPNDCSVVVTANEGEGVEGDDGVFFNPEGTISVLKFDDLNSAAAASNVELGFTAWNDKAEMYYQRGVHYGLRPETAVAAGYDPEQATLSKDLEPEYIAFSVDGRTAIIMLQDNNAIVSVDLSDPLNPTLGPLLPLGFKDWSGLYLDSSDKDDGIHMATYNGVRGMYQPDTTVAFEHDGETYIAFANEGDAKEYDAWTEEEKGEWLDGKLSPTCDADLVDAVSKQSRLGRIRVTTQRGALSAEMAPEDSTFQEAYIYGGRSFAIAKLEIDDGKVTKLHMVYESGDMIERLHMTHFTSMFNAEVDELADPMSANMDKRSDNKGVEPEAIETGTLSSGKKVLFVGNERTSSLMVYELSDPAAPIFQSISLSGDTQSPVQDTFTEALIEDAALRNTVIHFDPEDMHFIPAADSPTGKDSLLVVGALNGVLVLYDVVESTADDIAEAVAGPALQTANVPCAAHSSGSPTVHSEYAMKGVKLGDLNPHLSEEELSAVLSGNACMGRGDAFHCLDYPAAFSGMTLTQGSNTGDMTIFGITDNGPNMPCDDLIDMNFATSSADGRSFPMPNFSPAIVGLKPNTAGGLTFMGSCALKKKDGSPATGMGTGINDQESFGANCWGESLGFTQSGIDPEDIVQIPGTPYCWVVDEYNPSAAVISCDMTDMDACGTILMRYTPVGYPLPDAGYPVKAILPSVFADRRQSRGFEGGAVSPDGTHAYAFLQSPMYGDGADGQLTQTLRVLEFDITDPLNAVVEGEYLYMGESQWTNTANLPKDIKISAALWYGDMSQKHLLVLERAKSQVRIFKVDLGAATNVLNYPDAATKSYELTPAAFATAFPSIVTAPKTKVLDSDDIVTSTGESFVDMYGEKTEGMILVNDCVMGLGADNDFGAEGNSESKLVLVQLGTCLSSSCRVHGADTSSMRPGAPAPPAVSLPGTDHTHPYTGPSPSHTHPETEHTHPSSNNHTHPPHSHPASAATMLGSFTVAVVGLMSAVFMATF